MKHEIFSAQLNSNLIFKLPIIAAIFIPVAAIFIPVAAIFIPVAAIFIAITSPIPAFQWQQLPFKGSYLEPGLRRETFTNLNPLMCFLPTELSKRVML